MSWRVAANSTRGKTSRVMKTVIVDIDGTISDSRPRLHFVRPPPGEKRDNEAFHSRCSEDMPIAAAVGFVKVLARDFQIALLTGRPNAYRDQTQDWLDDNGVPYDYLIMRPDVDSKMPATEYKLREARALQAKGHDIFLVVEDQQKLVDMWRANGIHCLQTQAV